MNECIFCAIAEGKIPSSKLYEDENMIIIKDINPQAKLHFLLIPKKHYANITELAITNSDLLAKCLKKLAQIKESLGLQNGFRLITNNGKDAKQSVEHIHIHILGGEELSERMG